MQSIGQVVNSIKSLNTGLLAADNKILGRGLTDFVVLTGKTTTAKQLFSISRNQQYDCVDDERRLCTQWQFCYWE